MNPIARLIVSLLTVVILASESLYDLWHARRIAYRKHFTPGAYPSDICLLYTSRCV